ncbi:MAG: arsenic resistance N-acetyltransferase ArsN2 [Desulfobacterales bacterium]
MEKTPPAIIRPVSDRAAIRRLLDSCRLPTADLTGGPGPFFLGALAGEELLGTVGLEIYGEAALLRSLAVDPRHRGEGLAGRLLAAAEAHARGRSVARLYLLTTTAETYFRSRGYRRVPRAEAPEAIRGTREFASLCPQSAAFLVKELSAPGA